MQQSTLSEYQDIGDDTVCPTCRREFKNKSGMRTHHTKKHGESLSYVETTCQAPGCDTVFKYRKSGSHHGRFCSRSCSKKGENNPNYQAKSFTEESIRKLSEDRMGEGNPMYGMSGEDNPMYGVSGEDSPRWKGGRVGYYGPSWSDQREMCLKRDFYTCRLCGRSKDDILVNGGDGLSVHHRTPLRFYGVDEHEMANRLRNLLTLCSRCHGHIERVWCDNIDTSPSRLSVSSDDSPVVTLSDYCD